MVSVIVGSGGQHPLTKVSRSELVDRCRSGPHTLAFVSSRHADIPFYEVVPDCASGSGELGNVTFAGDPPTMTPTLLWGRGEMSISTLIVIPTFNEAENIASLVAAIRRVLPDAELLIVDDASPDGTGGIARGLARDDIRVHLIERPGKLGLGSAYLAGFRWGLARGYQRFFEIDADFSHDPKYLPAFVAALDAGADVVIGSRNVPGGKIVGWGPLRYLISKGGSVYSRLVLGIRVRDVTTGFKAYTRRALELITADEIDSNGYAFQVETTYRAHCQGLDIVELPIVFVDRRVGRSKMTHREVLEAMLGVWSMRRAARAARGERN
jgi:dolichol-phosphate mannosyltransferase